MQLSHVALSAHLTLPFCIALSITHSTIEVYSERLKDQKLRSNGEGHNVHSRQVREVCKRAAHQESKTRAANKTSRTTPINKKYNTPSTAAESFGMPPPKNHTRALSTVIIQNTEAQQALPSDQAFKTQEHHNVGQWTFPAKDMVKNQEIQSITIGQHDVWATYLLKRLSAKN